jgi:HD-like signal output (HDOD) protein
MNPDLEAHLAKLIDFPSLAGVAAQVVNLASDPEADLQSIAATVSADPALSAKLLRTANSPYYGRRRESKNLREAVMVLGLNATITLALGFSLVKTLGQPGKGPLDYARVWRRALLSAISGDAIAQVTRLRNREEIFLAGLLQDVGMLALDHSKPGFYAELPAPADHRALMTYERQRINADHAQVGAWSRAHTLPRRPTRSPPPSPSPEFCATR